MSTYRIKRIAVLFVLAVLAFAAFQYFQNNPIGGGESVVIRTLHAQGFENIETGPALLGYCESGELPTSFSATTKDGQPVSGVVCVNSFLQTAYIRYK
jgi:amino acid permease